MMTFDLEQIRSVASNLRNNSGEFKTSLDKIHKINQDIKTNWQGVAADSYISAIEEQYTQMSKLTETINGIADVLDQVAAAIVELEQANKASLGNGAN